MRLLKSHTLGSHFVALSVLSKLFPRGELAPLPPTSTLFASPICQDICQHTAGSKVPGLCQILVWEVKQSCLKSLTQTPPYNEQNPACVKPAPREPGTWSRAP